jgi:hypothetical protein
MRPWLHGTIKRTIINSNAYYYMEKEKDKNWRKSMKANKLSPFEIWNTCFQHKLMILPKTCMTMLMKFMNTFKLNDDLFIRANKTRCFVGKLYKASRVRNAKCDCHCLCNFPIQVQPVIRPYLLTTLMTKGPCLGVFHWYTAAHIRKEKFKSL